MLKIQYYFSKLMLILIFYQIHLTDNELFQDLIGLLDLLKKDHFHLLASLLK